MPVGTMDAHRIQYSKPSPALELMIPASRIDKEKMFVKSIEIPTLQACRWRCSCIAMTPPC
jgi:hypothetical protein